jgi:glycosyltransferase involved in cell wall biosynthesis
MRIKICFSGICKFRIKKEMTATKKMRICFFNSTTAWGGGEKWHLDMATELNGIGHNVTVISNSGSELIKRAKKIGLETMSITIKNLSFLNIFLLARIYIYFKSKDFDVLVMNFSKDLKVAAFMAHLAGVKKIIYRRGSDIPIKNTLLNRFIYGKCLTHILANSEATKKSILKNNAHLFPEEKIKVIYNGIKFEDHDFEEKANCIPVIGTLGRLEYQKRHDLLIKIAKEIKDRGIKCKFRIGGEGTQRTALEKEIADFGLEDMVELPGFIADSAKFLKEIDIFVLTSEWEGFGYVLAEAMRAKKPTIAFNISSNPELIEDGVNGYLISWPDIKPFADKIEELINNKQKQIDFGEKGYEIAKQKFDFEKVKQSVISYLLNG